MENNDNNNNNFTDLKIKNATSDFVGAFSLRLEQFQ